MCINSTRGPLSARLSIPATCDSGASARAAALNTVTDASTSRAGVGRIFIQESPFLFCAPSDAETSGAQFGDSGGVSMIGSRQFFKDNWGEYEPHRQSMPVWSHRRQGSHQNRGQTGK